MSDSEKAAKLGQGTYGSVHVAKHKPSGKTFALKTISRQGFVYFDRYKFIYWATMNETRFLIDNHSKWVMKSYCSFTDDVNLYLVSEVLEKHPKLDLWDLHHQSKSDPTIPRITKLVNIRLQKRIIYEQPIIKFLAAQLGMFQLTTSS